MKKALIIASCGLLLALVIGATSQSKPAAPVPESQKFIKCRESDDKGHGTECAIKQVEHANMRAEKFLRDIKYRARIAYV